MEEKTIKIDLDEFILDNIEFKNFDFSGPFFGENTEKIPKKQEKEEEKNKSQRK